MAIPTRPVQDAIIAPDWGQWVHDTANAPCGFRSTAAAVNATSGTWTDYATVALPNAPAGTYFAMTAAPCVSAGSTAGAMYLAIHTPPTPVTAADQTQISEGFWNSNLVSGTCMRLITHSGGTLTVAAAIIATQGAQVRANAQLTVALVSTAAPTAQAATRPGDAIDVDQINPLDS